MKSIETVASFNADGTLTAKIPAIISPGEHEVVIVVEEKGVMAKLKEKVSQIKINGFALSPTAANANAESNQGKREREPLRFSAYPVGLIADDFTFRREDLYDDDI